MGVGVGVGVRRVWVGVCACVGGCVSVASAIVRRPVLPLYVEDGRCTNVLSSLLILIPPAAGRLRTLEASGTDEIREGIRHAVAVQVSTIPDTPRRFNQSERKDPAGNRATLRPPDHRKETENSSGMVMSPVHQVWPKPSCKAK